MTLQSTPPNQSLLQACGFVAVCATGVTWDSGFIPFRRMPESGCTRDGVAQLAARNSGSVKRDEKNSPALSNARELQNQRVLNYRWDGVVGYLQEVDCRVDLAAAIRLGFPLGAIEPDKFGYLARGREYRRGAIIRLLPVPVNTVMQVVAGWETWHSLNSPAVMPVSRLPVTGNMALDRITVGALAALTEAIPSKPNLAQWASEVGRAPNQMQYSIADVARRLRLRLQTAEGQMLFALLLHTNAAGSPS